MFYVSAEASLQEVQLLLSYTAPVTSQLLQMEPFSTRDAIKTHMQSQTEHQVKNKEKTAPASNLTTFCFFIDNVLLDVKTTHAYKSV